MALSDFGRVKIYLCPVCKAQLVCRLDVMPQHPCAVCGCTLDAVTPTVEDHLRFVERLLVKARAGEIGIDPI